jgi:hypothetical protein
MAKPPADLMSRLVQLKDDFQHIADLHPWICISIPRTTQPGTCLLGEAGTGWEMLAEVVYPEDRTRRVVLDHVNELTFQAENLLMALIQYDSILPADLRQEIKDESPASTFRWVRWLRHAVPIQHIYRYQNYAQVSATALTHLHSYFDAVGLPPERTAKGSITTRKTKGKNTNARMLVMLADDPNYFRWSARQFAEHLGCESLATVKETKAWQQIMTYRAIEAAERVSRSGELAGGRHKKRL